MKKKKLQSKLLTILLLAFISVVFGLLLFAGGGDKKAQIEGYYSKYSSLNKPMVKSIVDNLSEITTKTGYEGAIGLIQTAQREGKIQRDECHELMHLVGHEVYSKKSSQMPFLLKKYGTYCQSGFPHGIEAQIALEETDTKARATKLQEYCQLFKKSFSPASCYHGAGHAYYQMRHDEKNALANCDTLKGKNVDLEPCYFGVFTELANDFLGVDSELGLAVAGKHRQIEAPQKPLLFCDRFDIKYRKACWSTLPLLVNSQRKNAGDLSPCLLAEYKPLAQEYCVEYWASFISRERLLSKDFYIVPESVRELPLELQPSYVRGLLNALNAFTRDGQKKDWRKICNSMSEKIQSYCATYISDNLGRNLE